MRRLLGLIVLVALIAPAPVMGAEASPPSDAPVITGPASAIDWQPVVPAEDASVGRIWTSSLGPSWVSVQQPDSGPPRAWRSRDGLAWSALELPDGIGRVSALLRASLPDEARIGYAIVADEVQSADRWSFEVWSSRDGREWALATSPQLVAPPELGQEPPVRHGLQELEVSIGALESYAAGDGSTLHVWDVDPGRRDPRLVEIGKVDIDGLEGRLLSAGDALWVVSTDSPAILSEFEGRLVTLGALPDQLDPAMPLAIARNRNSFVVAGSPRTTAGNGDDLRIWRGRPGGTWTTVLDRPGARPDSILADRAAVILAATETADGASVLLTSDDFGETWEEAASPWPAGANVCPGPLTSVGDGVVVLAAECPPPGGANLYAADLNASANPRRSTVPTARRALQCDFRPSRQGAGPSHWAGEPGYATPEEALRAGLREGWVVPRRGYRVLARDDDTVLYGFRDRGEVKVAIRVAAVRGSPSDWLPDGLAACKISEFGRRAKMGPGVWLWANRDGRTIQERRGPGHCDWQSSRFLYWSRPNAPETVRATRLYVRDPEGTFRDGWQAPYLRDTVMPAGARDTGYRRDGAELWMAPDERSVYIRRGGNVERWPRIPSGTGCA